MPALTLSGRVLRRLERCQLLLRALQALLQQPRLVLGGGLGGLSDLGGLNGGLGGGLLCMSR